MEEVVAGQVWRDWDSRYREHPIGRTMKVLRIEGEKAVVQPLTDISGQPCPLSKEKSIKLKRFRPTSTGYKLVQDVAAPREIEDPAAEPLVKRVAARRIRIARNEVARLERVIERRRRLGRSVGVVKGEARLGEARKRLESLTG